ncbi:MAG: hypothetical protein ABIM88_00785 [candidate division WOR-3 bacterium]
MSLWKQNKIRKQQRKKRIKKVRAARSKVLSLLAADKVKKASELASGFLVKHPDDVRAWRLVAGVRAWEGFGERLARLPARRRDELKTKALRILEREITSRDNLKPEVLAETLNSLIPPEELVATEEIMVASEPAEERPVESPPAEKPAKKKTTTKAKKTSAKPRSSKKKAKE